MVMLLALSCGLVDAIDQNQFVPHINLRIRRDARAHPSSCAPAPSSAPAAASALHNFPFPAPFFAPPASVCLAFDLPPAAPALVPAAGAAGALRAAAPPPAVWARQRPYAGLRLTRAELREAVCDRSVCGLGG